MSEMWMGPGTDPVTGARIGQQVLEDVHSPLWCRDHPCVIHHPSGHHMVSWPTLWRADIRLMERVCEHNIGHPDPDDVAHLKRTGRDVGAHPCDGCCVSRPGSWTVRYA